MSRVLVVSSDSVGVRMAGPGIRAWELSHALAAEHEVTLAVPGPVPAGTDQVRLIEARRSSLAAAASAHDVVVVQGSASDLLPADAEGGPAVVVDLYDPYPVEGLAAGAALPAAERSDLLRRDLERLRDQCRRGDFFMCASERQRLYWLGVLSAWGRVEPVAFDADPSLRRLLDVVPFGVPASPPQAGEPALRGVVPGIGPEDHVVLWGGGVWDWLDPLTLIRATAELAGSVPNLRVVFLGMSHPNAAVPRMTMAARARQLASELGLADRHVFFLTGWIPYADRGRYLAEADIGVSLHLDGVEADLAFRTRVIDYLWAGLPVLLTGGEATAELVTTAGAGLAVPPGDAAQVTESLLSLLQDGPLRASCRQAALELAGGMTWARVAEPLLRFCREPVRAHTSGTWAVAPAGGTAAADLRRRAWRVLRRDGARQLVARSLLYLRKRT